MAETWARADVEARKNIIRLMGMRVTIQPVGPGNGRGYDPDSINIEWDQD